LRFFEREAVSLSTNDLIIACIVGIPIVFALGRLSTRITWFHAKTEERYTIQEFVRAKE
jgi:hypothetical protein